MTSADDGMVVLSPTEEEENEESSLQMMLRLKTSMMRLVLYIIFLFHTFKNVPSRNILFN